MKTSIDINQYPKLILEVLGEGGGYRYFRQNGKYYFKANSDQWDEYTKLESLFEKSQNDLIFLHPKYVDYSIKNFLVELINKNTRTKEEWAQGDNNPRKDWEYHLGHRYSKADGQFNEHYPEEYEDTNIKFPFQDIKECWKQMLELSNSLRYFYRSHIYDNYENILPTLGIDHNDLEIRNYLLEHLTSGTVFEGDTTYRPNKGYSPTRNEPYMIVEPLNYDGFILDLTLAPNYFGLTGINPLIGILYGVNRYELNIYPKYLEQLTNGENKYSLLIEYEEQKISKRYYSKYWSEDGIIRGKVVALIPAFEGNSFRTVVWDDLRNSIWKTLKIEEYKGNNCFPRLDNNFCDFIEHLGERYFIFEQVLKQTQNLNLSLSACGLQNDIVFKFAKTVFENYCYEYVEKLEGDAKNPFE